MPRKIEFFTQDMPFAESAPPRGGSASRPSGRARHPGDDSTPQCNELKVPPDHQSSIHAHEADEIMYILAGQMIFGPRTLNAGDSLYIPGGTLYSFKSGPNGVQFLNFRARADLTNFSRDEFETLKTLEGEERKAFVAANIASSQANRGWR